MSKIIVVPDGAGDSRVQEAARLLPGARVLTLVGDADHLIGAFTAGITVPPSPRVEQMRRNAAARVDYLSRHGAMDAGELAELAGSTAVNTRSTASRWKSAGKVFSVTFQDRTLYPDFQFRDDGQPLPVIAAVLAALPDGLTGWALALWFDQPLVHDGRWVAPVEVLGNPDLSLTLARGTAGEWAADAA